MPRLPARIPTLFAALALMPVSALASPRCGPRDTLIAVLAERYGETRRSVGLAQATVVEVFASDTTGTWTITVTTPDGTMCLVAAGEAFQTLDDPLPARGDRI